MFNLRNVNCFSFQPDFVQMEIPKLAVFINLPLNSKYNYIISLYIYWKEMSKIEFPQSPFFICFLNEHELFYQFPCETSLEKQ